MKLKSLLLGSAAVLVAVSGANAADAIVVDAEPVEYVKVCDTYGAGYFYIPGGETCLKFSGSLRVQYTSDHDADHNATISDHSANVRARLTVAAKNETEYGTLSSSFTFNMQQNAFDNTTTTYAVAGGTGAGGAVVNGDVLTITETVTTSHDDSSKGESGSQSVSLVDNASISLAGFTMGYGNRIGGSSWTGNYDGNDAIYADYSLSAGDLALTFGIQDSDLSGAAGQPDVYARADYSAGDLSVGGSFVYDTSADASSYMVDGSYSLASIMDGAKITAFYSDGDAAEGSDLGSDYVGKKGHLWGVKLDYKLTDSITGFTRYNELEADANGAWRSGLKWAVADGFAISGHYNKAVSGAGAVEINFTRSF